MARMKFLCDAERCIECNACVTACKNEHEVPWGINRRRVVTLNDGKPGERSISMACMHCTDAPCMAVCPVDCFYKTDEGVVLHSKDLCIGCGYCFYACPFGAPQYPQVGNFGSRGRVESTFCAGGPEDDMTPAEYSKYGANRLAEGKLPLCAEMCSTKALLAGCWPPRLRIARRRRPAGPWSSTSAQSGAALRQTIRSVFGILRRRHVVLGSAGQKVHLSILPAAEVADLRVLRALRTDRRRSSNRSRCTGLAVQDDAFRRLVEAIDRAHRHARRVGAVHAGHGD